MKRTLLTFAAICACASLLASGAWAQQYIYPAKGQSPDQQKKDEAACHQWAVQQAQSSQQAAYGKAPAACLEGRGYTVK